MAGIYIHIPFCKKACHYCNFHFSTSLKLKNDFIQSLLKEIDLQADYLEAAPVDSIYFGGGTPSLLSRDELQLVLNKLQDKFTLSAQPEITLEANPDDITAEKLAAWKTAGVNRLSIGVQSFFENDLQWMNRAHSAQQAKNCIAMAQNEGFDNLTIDLIYGVPTLPDEHWLDNIQQALEMNIPHLSCYALTVEPGTTLSKMITLHKKENIDHEKQASQFLLLMDALDKHGYAHYEISNFALPGFRSRHNSSYWQGKPYLGLGPSAHSYNGMQRQWNIANNALYIQSISQGLVPSEEETLSFHQKLNEYIMISLRTLEGLDLDVLEKQFDNASRMQVEKGAVTFITSGRLERDKNILRLTREGKLFADGIAADLFFTAG